MGLFKNHINNLKGTRLRGIVSGVILAFFALFILIGGIISLARHETNGLNHPILCGFFSLLFILILWFCIKFKMYDFLENSIKNMIAKISLFNLHGCYKYISLSVYVVPAFCVLGSFIFRLVSAIQMGSGEHMRDELYTWIGIIPFLGDFMELSQTAIGSNLSTLAGAWQLMIYIGYGVAIIIFATVVVSIPARLFTGPLIDNNIGWRILVGFAMFIYALYLPELISSVTNGVFLDMQNMQNMLFNIDQLNIFLSTISYMLLTVILALFCSAFIWNVMIIFLAISIITIIPNGTDILNNLTYVLMIGGAIYVICKQVWGLVPTTNSAE